jgi:hypothetical protein
MGFSEILLLDYLTNSDLWFASRKKWGKIEDLVYIVTKLKIKEAF